MHKKSFLISESRIREIRSKYKEYIDAEIEVSMFIVEGNTNMYTLSLNNEFMIRTKQKYLDFLLKNWYSPGMSPFRWDRVVEYNKSNPLDTSENYREWSLRTMLEILGTMALRVEKIEYLNDFVKVVSLFDRMSHKFTYQDINQFPYFADVKDEYLKILKQKEGDTPKAKKIYDDGEYLVVVPLNHAASCKYGANTRWCTTETSDTNFRNITQKGPLYYIISKVLKSPFEKLAIHFDLSRDAENIEDYDWWDSTDDKIAYKWKQLLTMVYPKDMLKTIKEDFEMFGIEY